ncbi:MAG TPA: ATP-dependent helicase [Nitrospira sp.]|nr:ATP-dependent helicase [Nitrospira sp.]HNI20637.1 ATP-dependent helicase [Nitrospira sp.]
MKKARLSVAQTRVVEHGDGALLVVAGPGSGKTRVLTERVRRLLTAVPGHFRILALTFTNKAANEMKERLSDLGNENQRAFIGTMHSFCLEMLSERGRPVGVEGLPHVFEQHKDRKEILVEAVRQDPLLSDELASERDAKAVARRLDQWLASISWLKAHPSAMDDSDDEIGKRVLEAYDAGLRACGAYDFDDLLLLTYRLLSEYPKIADFYRRLYRFVCVDEAQDLNEAQYSVLAALCGDSYKSVMMVGDPKQSIYGFNTSSPDYMWRFEEEFRAERIELTDNFRSSKAVVDLAKTLDPNYVVEGQLPIHGLVEVFAGADEEAEAKLVADRIQTLMAEGHEDVEEPIEWESCAVLGRTRFALMAVESEFRGRGIPFYKRLTANHENESDVVEDFVLSLRVMANPKDRLHMSALAKRWKTTAPMPSGGAAGVDAIGLMATSAGMPRAKAVAEALAAIAAKTQRLDMLPGLDVIKAHADTLDEEGKRAVYEDIAVFEQEWDQYLRTGPSNKSVGGFMSSKALGATQQASREGVALLTVHSSKGLEFDVVFVVGMAEGVFPDYRAKTRKEQEEESRNAFVAVTRSKRLLYLTWPRMRQMPWGGWKNQSPSRFLSSIGRG